MEDNNRKNEVPEASDFEFLQEKIKERPVNKKKLLQRTIITASMALLFGLIACLTFLVLEPVLNNWLYPEEEPKVVTFPQEQEEMRLEDMLMEGEIPTEMPTSTEMETTNEAEVHESMVTENNTVVEEEKIYINEYQTLYGELKKLYQDVSKSIVMVTGVKSDVDWFNNTYMSEGSISGVIVANNNKELLILTKKSSLNKADSIVVEFCNRAKTEAIIKKYDMATDMAIIAVDLKNINQKTMDVIKVANIGSSMDSNLVGTPTIAIGNILGYKDSVCYGMITSKGTPITLPDSEYKLLTTDIYGCQNPTGILVNMEGKVIGIIENSYNNSDTKNLVSAIGITEMKGMITKLSNGQDMPYIGMYVQDIDLSVRNELGIPMGAYISDIDMDSPAFVKGVKKGDLIVSVGEQGIRTAYDFMSAVRSCQVDQQIKLYIKRAGKQEYQAMEIVVTPTVQPEKKK